MREDVAASGLTYPRQPHTDTATRCGPGREPRRGGTDSKRRWETWMKNGEPIIAGMPESNTGTDNHIGESNVTD